MLFKLALKNIVTKPFKALAIILAIAIVVSMFFSILSFNEIVYTYLYEQQVANRGNSDIFITYTGESERIMNVDSLKSIEGVKEVIPSLDIFATCIEIDKEVVNNDEYVRVRGFEKDGISKLNSLKVLEGNLEDMLKNPSGVAVSKRTAEALGLNLDSSIKLKVGSSEKRFFVKVIAENDGYFLTDEVYTFIGLSKGGISELVAKGVTFYNQVFVNVLPGFNVQDVIKNIKKNPDYENKNITVSIDEKYVNQNAKSLSAPIAVAGGAVAFLGITFIYVLFVLSEKERRKYASKLSIIGATRGQVFNVFLVENFILAFIGAIIGSALAVGIFIGIVKLTISPTMAFDISILKLFGAAVIGLLLSIVCSLLPLVKAFKSSVKENLMQLEKKTKFSIYALLIVAIIFIVTTIVEFMIPETYGIISIVNIILLLVCLALLAPEAMILISRGLKMGNQVSLKIAANNLVREKRNARTISLMSIGMIVSMLLFMAWNISTTVFSEYKTEIKNLIQIQNVQESVDLDEIKNIEGVDKAYKAAMLNGDFKYNGEVISANLIGTKHATELFDFKYITDINEINSILDSRRKEVIINENLANLYDIKIGDKISLEIKEKTEEFEVKGLTSSMIFGGTFLIISEDVLKDVYDVSINQVIVRSNDVDATANKLKVALSKNNYFVITALEFSSWTDRTTSAIFKLVGTIAGVITAFIFVALISSLVVSRSNSVKIRRALLSTGMSKNSLLLSEVLEHTIIAVIAYILAFAFSPLITAFLIHALNLFDLSFHFMYNAMVVGVVGLCMAVAYIITPIVLNFKGGYKLKVRE